jgi:hypothetical protein
MTFPQSGLRALREAGQLASALYLPQIFTIGSPIHPSEYVARLQGEGHDRSTPPNSSSLLHFHHELSHALLFLTTYYGARLLACIQDYTGLYVRSGGRLHDLQDVDGLAELIQFHGTLFEGANVEQDLKDELLAAQITSECLRYILEVDLSTSSVFIDRDTADIGDTGPSIVTRVISTDPASVHRFDSLFPCATKFASQISGRFCHFYLKPSGSQIEVLRINSGCLAEAVAVLAEVSFIELIEDTEVDEFLFLEHIDSLPLAYSVCFEVLLHHCDVPYQSLRSTLTAILDIAFTCGTGMFGWMVEAPSEVPIEVLTPADIFLNCCATLRELKLPSNGDEIPSFRSQLYNKIGFRDERTILGVTAGSMLEHFDQIYHFREGERIETSLSLYAQVNTYKKSVGKRHDDETTSILGIIEPEKALEYLALSGNAIHFYNSDTRDPYPYVRMIEWERGEPVFKQLESFANAYSDQSWGGALLGSAVLELASGEYRDCPLKRGTPYRCQSFGYAAGHVCTWNGTEEVINASDRLDVMCPYAALKDQAERMASFIEELTHKLGVEVTEFDDGKISIRSPEALDISEEEYRRMWLRHFKGWDFEASSQVRE